MIKPPEALPFHDYGVSNTQESGYIASSLLKNCSQTIDVEMVHLSSGGRVHKFSVNSSIDTEFVHMFKGSGDKDWYMQCKSGMCQHSLGKQVKVETLLDDGKICSHLQVMLKNHASWETLMCPTDEDDDGAFDDIEDNDGDEKWSSDEEDEGEFDDRDYLPDMDFVKVGL